MCEVKQESISLFKGGVCKQFKGVALPFPKGMIAHKEN